MSSVLEKSKNPSLLEKRSFFLRTSSLQKIKCSATYPFRVLSTKISRDSIKQLLESHILSGRILSHKAILNFYITTLKLVGALASIWVGVPASALETGEICDKTKRPETSSLCFRERLLEKVKKIQLHKARLESTKIQLQQQNGTKVENNTSSENVEDDGGNDFKTEIARLRSYSGHNSEKSIPEMDLSIGSLVNSPTMLKNIKSKRLNNLIFTLSVYGCALLIYLQLLLLGIALNTTKLPPGLIFLVTSLLIIGVIALKVFILEKSKKNNGKRSRKQRNSVIKFETSEDKIQKSTKVYTGESNENENEKEQNDTQRQSRSKDKKFVPMINLNSKTISKVKLL